MRAFRGLMAIAVCASAVATGCMGEDASNGPSEPDVSEPDVAERVDSSLALKGKKRELAQLVETFEEATRDNDEKRLCNSILGVQGSTFGDRSPKNRICAADPELGPKRELEEAGVDDYDLEVTYVSISPKDDRFKPDATVTVSMPDGAPNDVELFELQQLDVGWRLVARHDAGTEGEVFEELACSDGATAREASTDEFGGEEGRPVDSAREILDDHGRVTKRFGVERALPLPAIDSSELVRTGVGYAYGGATYELRAPEGDTVARFDVARLDKHYYLVHQAVCEERLKLAFG